MKHTLHDINLEAGDDVSSFAGQVCRTTYDSSPYVVVDDFSDGHFRGPRGIHLKKKSVLKDVSLTLAADGIGPKVALTNLAGFHRKQARDLFAMTGGDITRWGGLRLALANILDVNTFGKSDSVTRFGVEQLILGLGEVGREQKIVVLTGESAEVGQFVGSVDGSIPLKYSWVGTMLGVYDRRRLIQGKDMEPGDLVVALRECGFRSNGFTIVNDILSEPFGSDWWRMALPKIRAAVLAAAEPSVLYDAFLEEANGWTGKKRIPVKAIAHISGGGIPTKFGDLLMARGLSAKLGRLFEPPRIMQRCVMWGKLSHKYAYERWNCGQGVVAVLSRSALTQFLKLAKIHGIEATVCGEITKEKPVGITIISKFQGGGNIFFPLGSTS